ncbi:unnamed protein product [Tetraodon nigroviridis]|uniref:Chromosome 16 SCAF13905, whole genome shotgun sequence n=1 Tax=Tetraodon nigroviridis TaxID=99883 RepID=Q4SUJ2_TETNG|nr:unnamed protein product [Tetraodon nigroviridis]
MPTFGGSGGGISSAEATKLWTERELKQPGAPTASCGFCSSPAVFYRRTEDKRKVTSPHLSGLLQLPVSPSKAVVLEKRERDDFQTPEHTEELSSEVGRTVGAIALDQKPSLGENIPPQATHPLRSNNKH